MNNRWHGTLLAKLALIPQNLLNAYISGPANPNNGQYKEGDLVATFPGCEKDKKCAEQMGPYFDMLANKDE